LGGNVFLLEFSCNMPFDECGLANSSVSDEDNFELSDWLGLNYGIAYCLHVLIRKIIIMLK
jgi:hypothetical protein